MQKVESQQNFTLLDCAGIPEDSRTGKWLLLNESAKMARKLLNNALTGLFSWSVSECFTGGLVRWLGWRCLGWREAVECNDLGGSNADDQLPQPPIGGIEHGIGGKTGKSLKNGAPRKLASFLLSWTARYRGGQDDAAEK